jgi:hypothetical protein
MDMPVVAMPAAVMARASGMMTPVMGGATSGMMTPVMGGAAGVMGPGGDGRGTRPDSGRSSENGRNG